MSAEDEGRPAREPAGAPQPGGGAAPLHVTVVGEGPEEGAQVLRRLEEALRRTDAVHMLVIGDDERAAQIVGWARPLCERGRVPGGPERRILWIRNPEVPEVGIFLAMLLWLPLPRVAVVNARDWVRVRIADAGPINEEVLERAFQQG